MFLRKESPAEPHQSIAAPPAATPAAGPIAPPGDRPSTHAVRRLLLRLAKIAGALTVLGVGARAIMVEDGYISSDNAVVSARVISFRSPIEGVVASETGGVGSPVVAGQVVAHIDNPRLDDQHLAELRATLARTKTELAAAVAERTALLDLQARLRHRAEDYSAVAHARLVALVNEADNSLAALAERQREVMRELDRRAQLQRTGDVPPEEVERLRAEVAARQREIAAQGSRTAALRAEAEAASDGIFVDEGGNDAVYSAQRSDEIAIRLVDLTRRISELTAAVSDAEAQLVAEERRIALLRTADLAAPENGMIWKLGAAVGERVGPGDVTAEIVDCAQAFLLVAVPQSYFSEIPIGATARFRLSGEREERQGTVAAVTGQRTPTGDVHLAAAPLDHGQPTALVQISVPPSPNAAGQCLVGRTARVLLPSTGGGLLRQMTHLLF